MTVLENKWLTVLTEDIFLTGTEQKRSFSHVCECRACLLASESTHRHMTVGLVDFDSNVGRILVLLNTNGVCVTDSATESDTREKGYRKNV